MMRLPRCNKCDLCEQRKRASGWRRWCKALERDVTQSHFGNNSPKVCPRRNTIFCNPDVCDYCQYIGDGDSWCDVIQELVLEDWIPTDAFMSEGCVVAKGGYGHG